MKKTMMFTIIAIVSIILMVVFDISLPTKTEYMLASKIPADSLFVCPVGKSAWTSLAHNLMMFSKPIKVAFFFSLMILIAVWLWALYQNLLKDKFDRASFKTPWGYTKLLFWATICVFMLMKTPNYFRFVQVDGREGNWVLCDSSVKNAQLETIDKIHFLEQ